MSPDISTRILSAGPTDPDGAENALSALYRRAGLETPEFIWSTSPLAGFRRVKQEFEARKQDGLGFHAAAWLMTGRAGNACFCPWCLALSVNGLIHGRIDTRWSQTITERRSLSVEAAVMGALRGRLDDSLDDRSRPMQVLPSKSGLMDRPYCNPWVTAAVLASLEPETESDARSSIRGNWLRLAMAAGWWWPYHDFAVLSARPTHLETSDRGLHRQDGPALQYPDGWSLNAVENVLLPTTAFEPGGLSFDQVHSEPNLAVRRILIELYGAERYLSEAGGDLVSEDGCGQLWRLWVPGRMGRTTTAVSMVRVVDSTAQPDGTRRTYWLHVPPAVRTARQAVAWTFGLEPDQYDPEVET